MRTKPNYGWLDRFRLIAALLVIAIHTSPLASVNEGADFFLTRVLARVAVPFFFMVTGQFVAVGFLSPSVKSTARFHKYLLKTSLLYVFCILLYLPIGIYAGHYKDITVGAALRMFIFDGTFYHLWYFPACILGVLLVYLMSRFLSLRGMTIVSAVLYLIGLFGDSYFGLVQKVPPLESAYEFCFQIFSYTRNGLFLAPIFLVLGAWIGNGQKRHGHRQKLLFLCMFTAFSFAVMTGEAFLLRHFELQRHDSMYLALIPTMFFLYRCLICLPKKSSGYFRSASTWIYMLHPAFIVVVRGVAKPLHMTELLVDSSVLHYLAVSFASVAAAFVIAFVQAKLSGRLLRPQASNKAGKAMPANRTHKKVRPIEEDTWETDDASSDTDMYDTANNYNQYDEALDMDTPEDEMADVHGMEDEISDTNQSDAGLPDYQDTEEAGWQESYPAADPQASASYVSRQSRASGQTQQDTRPFSRRPLQVSKDQGRTPSSQASATRAWVEVSASALAQNVAFLQSRLPEHCRLMPAVKAEAYGHGAVIVSRELNRLGVDAFCVACISEGIQLREADIQGEILVLGYTSPQDFPLLAQYQLTQIIVDYPYAQLLNQSGLELSVHIGIDTGMHRLGIRCDNLQEIKAIYEMQNLKIDGICTHLCASDSSHPRHRAFTDNQVKAFYQVIDTLKAEGYPCPGLHLLASYGILNLLQGRKIPDTPPQRFAERRSISNELNLAADYVRPGIALYGILSNEEDSRIWQHALRPVLSLKAKVASIRTLYAGEDVGYGITFTAPQDMRIAAITIGYADGLPRELSGGKGSVLINGCIAPIVGRICMDQTIVDVSSVPQIHEGDEAVIIGRSGNQEITVGQIAGQCGTITNEILSRLGSRLGRILSR